MNEEMDHPAAINVDASVKVDEYDPDTEKHLVTFIAYELSGMIDVADESDEFGQLQDKPISSRILGDFSCWVRIDEPVHVKSVYYGHYHADFETGQDTFKVESQVLEYYVSLFNLDTKSFLCYVDLINGELFKNESKDPNHGLKFFNGESARSYREIFVSAYGSAVSLEPCLVSHLTDRIEVE